MWKTGFSLDMTVLFYQQLSCGKGKVINRQDFSEKRKKLSTVRLSTIHNSCGKNQRLELILEVMSRMVFFRVSLPLWMPLSTF